MKALWNSVEVTKRKIIEFGVVIFVVVGLIIPLIGFILNDYHFGPHAAQYFFISFLFLTVCLIFPKVVEPIYKVWMLFALGLGFIMTRFIITVVYFILITPIGLVRRISKSDTPKWIRARKTIFKDKTSYWIQRNGTFNKESAERQF